MNKNIDELVAENIQLKDKLSHLQLHLSEVEATTNHLVSATWRERDMKKKLADTIEELNNTKQLLEMQNHRVSESINYARKIQLAININENDLKNTLKNSFIYYKPKDVISGDFPWMYETGNYVYLAAVDCTGHGVPGAMLSMIGNLLLNEIARTGKNATPAEILLELHKQVVVTLKQHVSGSNSNDGMDVALIRIDRESNELFFSGAHRPLLLLRNGELTAYPGSKFPIGGLQYKGKNEYTDQKIALMNNDKVFIFSDGIVDQPGGNEGKKWMMSGLKEFLINNQDLPIHVLKDELERTFLSWMLGRKQIDDVLIIGFNPFTK